jgi:drug/metabolite transporter (DMT)-like permease
MDATDVAAALLSALLHAGWNAAVKANPNPARAMAAQMMSALLVLPGLLWTGLPPLAAWPWIAGSSLVNVVIVTALLRAYELGGFGLVYPVVRALGVVLVVPLVAVVAGSVPGPMALLGILVIALSLAVLALDAARGRGLSSAALAWIAIAGLATAGYVLCDSQGVRAAGSPWAYGFVVCITNAAAMGWRQRHNGPPWRQMQGQWTAAVPTAIASTVSYLLILWVWGHAPVAPASALRDTSSVFALLIAVLWLREPFTRVRILAVLLATAAVPLLRLG